MSQHFRDNLVKVAPLDQHFGPRGEKLPFNGQHVIPLCQHFWTLGYKLPYKGQLVSPRSPFLVQGCQVNTQVSTRYTLCEHSGANGATSYPIRVNKLPPLGQHFTTNIVANYPTRVNKSPPCVNIVGPMGLHVTPLCQNLWTKGYKLAHKRQQVTPLGATIKNQWGSKLPLWVNILCHWGKSYPPMSTILAPQVSTSFMLCQHFWSKGVKLPHKGQQVTLLFLNFRTNVVTGAWINKLTP